MKIGAILPHLKIFGDEIHDYSEKQFTSYRRDRVGFIFQFFNLFPALNAVDNIIIGIDILKRRLKRKKGLKEDLDTHKIAKEYLCIKIMQKATP